MIRRSPAFTDDSKGVVFHDRGAADSAQETLLHPAVETENGDFGRWLKPYVSGFSARNKNDLQFQLLQGLLEE
jgi:hypothetical protein